jgi:hypothetical protein
MGPQFWLNVVVRWVHISSAVVGVGALVFLRLVLLPAVQGTGDALSGRIIPRAKLVIHTALGLLLLTGFYNLYVVIPKANALGELKSTYHAVLGTKILLAFVLFGVASTLFASLPDTQTPRLRRPGLLLASIVLAAIILFLSAILRRTWDLAP